jgi:hypothetical protein
LLGVLVDFLLFVVLIGSASTSSSTSWLTVVSLDVSFLVEFPFPVVAAVVSSEVDDDLTGLEADEVAAWAECQLVSS